MSELLKKAINSVVEGKPVDFQTHVNAALKEKIADALDTYKLEVAKDISESCPKGEERFKAKHKVVVHPHPVAGDNVYKGGPTASEDHKRPADKNEDGDEEDPEDVGAKLKKEKISGKTGS